MKHLIILLLILIAVTKAQTIIIGNGTYYDDTPFFTSYSDVRTNLLYLSSEIIAGGGYAGVISQIGFDVRNASTRTMNGFQIKMQHTSLTSLSGIVESGWVQVYSGTYIVPGPGWQYFNLSIPFSWNGIDNLLVEVCFDNSDYGGSSSVYCTQTPTITRYRRYVDGGSGCDLTNSQGFGSGSEFRANIALFFDPVPVELSSFVASVLNNKVELEWFTETELNNYGFEVQRKCPDGDFLTIGFVAGKGTITSQSEYKFIDKRLQHGKYFYRLKQIDFDNTFTFSIPIEVEVFLQPVFDLGQNYPNPFNPSTKICYSIPERSFVTLKIYDIIGNEIITLVNEQKDSGYYEVTFDASNLANNVYLYELRADNFREIKKLVLIK